MEKEILPRQQDENMITAARATAVGVRMAKGREQ